MSIIAPKLYKPRPAAAGGNRLRCMAQTWQWGAAAGLSRWAGVDVTYSASFTLPGLTQQRTAELFDEACARWNSVCGIKLRRVQSGGNIIPGAGRIDGGGGTLAYSYIPGDPSPMSDQLQQVYDTAEAWTEKFALDVFIHELGHAAGLPHVDDPASIMYPWANGKNSGLARWEIEQMVARYGKPAPVTPPTQPPVDPPAPVDSWLSAVIRFGGFEYAVNVERSPI